MRIKVTLEINCEVGWIRDDEKVVVVGSIDLTGVQDGASHCVTSTSMKYRQM